MKNFFHFICVVPCLIPRLIKKELALDFLQMFLSKQINLCILSTAFWLLLWAKAFMVDDRAEILQKIILLSFWHAAADFLDSCHIISVFNVFGRMCRTNAGQMQRQLQSTITPLYGVSVFMAGSTPFSWICTNTTLTTVRHSVFISTLQW